MRQPSLIALHSLLSLAASVGLTPTLSAQTPPTPGLGSGSAPRIPIFFVESRDQGSEAPRFAGRSGGLNTFLYDDRIALRVQGECQQADVSLCFEGAV
ncbi:MAG: hypothetical protein IPK72_22040, partial [Candidatus Eisenbacteria bacterium]|nr:hypothetical protein [Candidatus Eisenbacteria bacterium]